MVIPAGESPYLEAVVSFTDARTHKEKRFSGKGVSRMATEEAIIAAFRGKLVSISSGLKDCKLGPKTKEFSKLGA